ncbi:MAG: SprT family zinc-dependent metalloprotease [Usitatibacter sp.]
MARLELVSRDLHAMEMGGQRVDYVLLRRRGRRGVGMKVDETGLTVSAPSTFAVAKIEALVLQSEAWVLRKILEWSARQVPLVEWTDGALLPYLGITLILRTREGKRARVDRFGDELCVATARGMEEDVRRAVVGWYRRSARAYLQERVDTLAQRAGIPQPRMLVSSAHARWGSCNERREVRLAWRLMKAPPQLVDYVVCHELAHLRHMDHSAEFWAEVERQCPGHKAMRAELFATDHLYRSF